jgi:hypothetical protein
MSAILVFVWTLLKFIGLMIVFGAQVVAAYALLLGVAIASVYAVGWIGAACRFCARVFSRG